MAEASILPPRQHKQPSRKGKKAWRKNVDITQVESGLEDVRDEVIQHGGIVSEKSATDLFITDTAGSKEIQKSYRREHKPLKADEILAQRSAVPSVGTHKRAAGTTDGVQPSSKRHKGAYVSAKDYENLRKIAYGGDTVKKDVVQQGVDADYDPWAVSEPVKQPEYSFLEKKKEIREPGTLKRAPVSMAKNGKAIPSVRKPEAGKSYNPVFEDWSALIEREGEKAVADEVLRLEEERKDEELQARIEKAQAEAEKEWESEWESEWEGILSEREEEEKDKEWLKKKRPERKTPAERNKVKRRRVEAAKRKHEERMKTKDDIKSKALARATAEIEPSAFESEEDSSEDEEEPELRRGRMGKAELPNAPLEVVLPDELEDSLRRLKPEGNLLKDRFRSMILQGKIESRAPIRQPKQAKRKATEKWSYKDWKLPK